jgi:hypothetical protein
MNEFLQRLSSRKFWAPIIVTALMTYNAWEVLDRGLEWTEIVAIASVWGLFIGAEGASDFIERKTLSQKQK